MQKKYIILLTVIIALSGLTILEYSQGTISGLIFSQMPYSYYAHVLIPPTNQSNGTYLGGYYKINGTGQKFNLFLNLTGAENSESPLDYTSGGLHVTGQINTIKVTPATIIALTQNNFKQALFNTILTGNMTMTSGVWTGTSKFQNNGQKFTGTFQIPGPHDLLGRKLHSHTKPKQHNIISRLRMCTLTTNHKTSTMSMNNTTYKKNTYLNILKNKRIIRITS